MSSPRPASVETNRLLDEELTSSNSANAESWGDEIDQQNYGVVAMTPLERCAGASSRCLHSRYYLGVLVLTVVLSLSSLAWTLAEPVPTSPLFICLELAIISVLVLEVSVGCLSSRYRLGHWGLGAKDYLSKWGHRFDVLVLLMCFIALILYLVEDKTSPSSGEQAEEYISLALLIIRSITQGLRLIMMIRGQKRRIQASKGISFSQSELYDDEQDI